MPEGPTFSVSRIPGGSETEGAAFIFRWGTVEEDKSGSATEASPGGAAGTLLTALSGPRSGDMGVIGHLSGSGGKSAVLGAGLAWVGTVGAPLPGGTGKVSATEGE